jgi:hypothetical protein
MGMFLLVRPVERDFLAEWRRQFSVVAFIESLSCPPLLKTN